MVDFSLINSFSHFSAGFDDRIGGVDGSWCEVAGVVQRLRFLFHLNDLNGACCTVISVCIGAGAVRNRLNSYEIQDFMAVRCFLQACFIKIDQIGRASCRERV